jgi:hypothetical protein
MEFFRNPGTSCTCTKENKSEQALQIIGRSGILLNYERYKKHVFFGIVAFDFPYLELSDHNKF